MNTHLLFFIVRVNRQLGFRAVSETLQESFLILFLEKHIFKSLFSKNIFWNRSSVKFKNRAKTHLPLIPRCEIII